MDKIVVFFTAPNLKSIEIQKIVSEYKYFLGGFYTLPIKEKNEIIAYNLISLSGVVKTLASKNFISPLYVNKYAIDKNTIENFAIKEIENSIKEKKIILVDEFGTFFLKSEKFIKTIVNLMANDLPVIIWARNIKEIRKTFENIDDVSIYLLTAENRVMIRQKITMWLYNKIKERKNA